MGYDDFEFERSGRELDDNEFPEPDVGDDEIETIPCPECGAEVYEDAPRCPYCGAYVTADTRPWSGRPLWWIILGVAGVLATILALSLLAP